jgi:regulatory protein
MSDYNEVFEKAAGILTRRPHFTEELKQKLLRKGYNINMICQIITDFTNRNYLNDKYYAKQYMHELLHKGYGRYKILHRLVSKGVSRELAEETIQSCSQIIDNEEARGIKALLAKKRFNLDDINEKAKAVKFLKNKGYDLDQIRKNL